MSGEEAVCMARGEGCAAGKAGRRRCEAERFSAIAKRMEKAAAVFPVVSKSLARSSAAREAQLNAGSHEPEDQKTRNRKRHAFWQVAYELRR
jgi:hypothetical protein